VIEQEESAEFILWAEFEITEF